MDGWAAGLFVVLSVWLCLSVLVQLSAAWPRLGRLWRWDALGLLPQYHFFAPSPVRHDYHLLVRTYDQAGIAGAWFEAMGPPPRRPWNIVWNPDRRAYKSLCDLMQVVSHGSSNSPRATQLSLPYLAILNYACAVVRRDHVTTHVQFLLAVSHGPLTDVPPQAVFLSVPHRLTNIDDPLGRAGDADHRDARVGGRGDLVP
jgi:hypothetical protein